MFLKLNNFASALVTVGLLLLQHSTLLPFVHANTNDDQKSPVEITFRNELPEPVVIYFEGDNGERIPQNGGRPIPAKGGIITIKSFPGHTFSYEYGGHYHYENTYAPKGHHEDRTILRVLLAGQNEIGVQCTVTANQELETLNLRIIPWWAPHGAARFLTLIRSGYYNGAALNRVVPNFLTQFGISADYVTRTRYRQLPIRDDKPEEEISFQPGMLSYAGSGENSRTTEVFVVMPGASQRQLDHFGVNPWETPFGIINDVDQTAVAKWYSYGDMPPWVSFEFVLICMYIACYIPSSYMRTHTVHISESCA